MRRAMRDEVLYGDCLTRLKDVPEGCAQTCVTSPPYYGLRDYGTRRWFGGDLACEHDQGIEHGPHHPGQVEQTKWKTAEAAGKGQTATTHSCTKCSAWFGQLGLEPTPEMYVEHLVEVFRGVRRVLRDDGTLWLNLGDSYANDTKWGGATSGKHTQALHGSTNVGRLAAKNLIGIPWMTAFALRADGWVLRSEIIWHKPNTMPESVEDRPTRAHEHVFLLTKSQTYFYDADAIREKTTDGARNKRTVWTINTEPYKGAHFAVMAPELAITCIRAGSKPGDLVVDPFTGSGTTLQFAKDFDRDFLGIEVNEDYRALIEQRTLPAIEKAELRSMDRAMWARVDKEGS